jgi:bifunctional non-homologous end joining protein LigD
MAKRASTHRSPARFNARMLPGAKPETFPGVIEPQLATQKNAVPSGDGWLHEIKFDGYRVQGHLIEGRPALITRNGHNWTARMPSLAAALGELPANSLILDGEVIVPDGKGASDFDALEIAMGPRGRSADMLFYTFDILHLDGFDLRAAPLIERKRVLKELLAGVAPPILYSDHMDANGQKMFEHASGMGLEGIISKRVDAPYRSGRTESWIKVKCVSRGTFTVVGYAPEGTGLVASLHLARKEGRELVYVGKVGTGWSMAESAKLRQRLASIEVERAAVAIPGRAPKAVWVRPSIKVDVEYRAITTAGLLRHAVWRGNG